MIHDQGRQWLISALRQVLKPILRFCVRYCIYMQDFFELTKSALVEVAKEELLKAGQEPSVNRISIMTGVHRREVTRIFREQIIREEPRGYIGRVMGQWQQDKKFMNKQGKPRVLTCYGPDSEFKKLVAAVSKDLCATTILMELERVGAISRTGQGVRLEMGTFVPVGDMQAGLALLGADTADLMNAVTENIFSPPDVPNLHAKTEYDNISKEAIPEIREWFIAEGSRFHQQARAFLSKFDNDVTPVYSRSHRGVRVALGTFSIIESEK